MGEEKAKDLAAGTLFPILGQGRVGIARLAAAGEKAGEGHLVEFRTMEPRSLLNRTVSKRMNWMTWSINPYRGCEFGCRYCYARYTHEFLDKRDPELFEREIYIKQHAAWLLQQELKEVRPGEQIALGTATDPYQPIERRAQVTRSLLEVFAEQQGLRLGIVTKATLIERDIDLLVRIAGRNRLTLHLTITTPDAKLARILEPRAPSPDLRFRTAERLRAARRAKKVGASFFVAQPLFLKPCSKPVFLRFIQEHFPELEKVYAARYGEKAFVSKAYQERVAALVKAVVRKYGLEQRFSEALENEKNLDLPTAGRMPVWPAQGELWPGSGRQARSA